jgi:DNA polymerase (family X)
MPIHNSDIATIFSRVADLLEIENANPFRVRAYRNAARVISGMGRSIPEMVAEDADLTELSGIGADLSKKIREIVETGSLKQLGDIEKRVPPSLADLLGIPGLGPKRVGTIYRELGVETLDGLREAAEAGRIRALEGFGEKTEEQVLSGIGAAAEGGGKRIKLVAAEEFAEPLVAYLREAPGVKAIAVAGSYRRRKETVGDLDILVTQRRDADIMERFVAYDDVDRVVSRGKTRSTVILRSGLHVDLRAVAAVSYGAALHYFTGSKAHNVAIRQMALKQGLKVNEYGVFREDERIAGQTEEAVYEAVGLPYIPPELRENRGEIEAAGAGDLPELITEADIRGDLHAHTEATDGRHSIEEMARAARDRGYDYLAITEHSKQVSVAGGMNADRLAAHIREIETVNDRIDGITLLKGVEVDILADGSLDLPDGILGELDMVIASIHYRFGLPDDRQTERLLAAMDNPHVSILGHPTGRLIGEREPMGIDMGRVMAKAKDRAVCLELNSFPDRLDLSDIHCKMARETGVTVVISTDAHSTDGLGLMRYGVGQARRGWLTPADVLNTAGLDAVRSRLKRG